MIEPMRRYSHHINAVVVPLLIFSVSTLSACKPDATTSASYPDSQRNFFSLNKACGAEYSAGINEIQKSLAFNKCNAQRTQFAQQQRIIGWTGTIETISTDQGADVVLVEISAEIDGKKIEFSTNNNRLSDAIDNTLITPNNPLFNAVARMKEGDLVSFDATFLPDSDNHRGVREMSLTENGSMTDPTFVVQFSDIRPYGATQSSVPNQLTEQPTSNVEYAPPARPIDTAPSADAATCRATLPAIKGVAYGEARKLLIGAGYRPVKSNTSDDDLSFGARDARAAGYVEVENCADTGTAPCRSVFTSEDGRLVSVISEYERAPAEKEVTGYGADVCTPITQPSTDDAVDANDLSPAHDFRLTLTGFGPLKIGMTKEEIETAGYKLTETEEGGTPECSNLGLANRKGIGLIFRQNRLASIHLNDGPEDILTSNGIHIGDTVEKARQAFGKALIESPGDGYVTLTISSKDGSSNMEMFTDGSVINGIAAGRSLGPEDAGDIWTCSSEGD